MNRRGRRRLLAALLYPAVTAAGTAAGLGVHIGDDPYLAVVVTTIGSLVVLALAAAGIVWIRTDAAFTVAQHRVQDAWFSVGSLSEENRKLSRENVWLRAQLEGLGKKVTVPPARPVRAVDAAQPGARPYAGQPEAGAR